MRLDEAEVELFDCEHKTPAPAAVGIPYIAIPEMKEGRLDVSNARLVGAHDVPIWNRRVTPKEGDIILSRRTNPGVTAVVPPNFPCVLGQNLVILRSRGSKVDQGFLRWLVRGPEWWQQIEQNLNVGAVFDSLRCADIPRFELTIPPLPEQRAIAHILGSLDDKIELNRRMNEGLEAIARALFKSWFVDFDPVRAMAEGRETGLPPEIAALFPDSFEETEIGEVPKGWKVDSLSNHLSALETGGRPTGGAVRSGIPSIGAENVIGLGKYDFSKEKFVPKAYFESMTAGRLVRGDVLLYKDGAQLGRSTHFDQGFPHERCAVNEHVFVLRMKPHLTQRYLYFWVSQDWMKQEIANRNSNSAQPALQEVHRLSRKDGRREVHRRGEGTMSGGSSFSGDYAKPQAAASLFDSAVQEGEKAVQPAEPKRNVFISFHVEDEAQVNLLRSQAANQDFDMEFRDYSVKAPFDEAWRRRCAERIAQTSMTIVMIGPGTANREAVNWEIEESYRQGKKVIGVRIYRDANHPVPEAMARHGAPIINWSRDEIAAQLRR